MKLFKPFHLLAWISLLCLNCNKGSTPPKSDIQKVSKKSDENISEKESTGFFGAYSGFFGIDNQKDPFRIADLDGDSLSDTVFLVRMLATPPVDTNLVISPIYDSIPPKGDSSRALVIAFNHRANQEAGRRPYFLFHDSGYFATPLWEEAPWKMVRIVHRGAPNENHTLDTISDVKGDLIGMDSEGLVEFFLYFDGHKFKTHYTDDEP